MSERLLKAIYQFKDMGSTGIDAIPVDRLIYVEQENVMLVKKSDAGLTSSTTIADAINLQAVVPVDFMDKQYHDYFTTDDIVTHDEYATETRGGVVKMRLDISDPNKPKLYMTTNGNNP